VRFRFHYSRVRLPIQLTHSILCITVYVLYGSLTWHFHSDKAVWYKYILHCGL
jgi:hypothetical protein